MGALADLFKSSRTIGNEITQEAQRREDYRADGGYIRPTPQHPLLGALSRALQGASDFASQPFGYNNPPGRVLSELLGVPATARTLERLSYGEPLTTGTGWTTQVKPDTADALLAALPVASPAFKAAERAAVATGKAITPAIERAVPAIMERGGMPAQMLGDLAYGTKSNVVPTATHFPQQEALDLAQRNAALPVEQGGLGLRPDNTPMERAAALGYADDGYHGSMYDIKEFNRNRASTESHAGMGTYITDSPEDASVNYASVYGPDVRGKIERNLESLDKEYRHLYKPLQDETLTGNQQRLLAERYLGADNQGVVYPVMYRKGTAAHLDNPKQDTFIGPMEQYDEAADSYLPAPDYHRWERAQQLVEDAGDSGTASDMFNAVADSGATTDGDRAGDIYKTVQKATDGTYNDNGDLVSSGVLAGEFLRGLGVDTIQHTPRFGNPQLNLGNTHSIVFDPKNIRSRFAAFDPMRRDSPDILAGLLPLSAPMADDDVRDFLATLPSK